ncbi:MAG: sulfatase, partial [Planctomycetota bacterium]
MRPSAVPVVLALITLLVAGCSRDASPPGNLILITLDTTRADALGVYGAPPGITPNLDRLATRALVFERAYSTAPFTGPSHSSILTSQHPSTHGVLFNGHRVDGGLGADSITLAEHLSGAGFATGAVVSAGPLAERYGFARGFDTFQHVKQSGHGDSGGAGRYVSEIGEQWLLRRPRDKRFFLWLHYFDPHLPYVNGRGVREALGVSVEGPVTEESIRGLSRDEVEQCYRAEVFEMDRFIGRVMEQLALHD